MLSHPTAAITDHHCRRRGRCRCRAAGAQARLSAEAMKSEMGKGNVSSVAEAGINEDAGRTRLTFRYRTRAWTVVVEPDGTVIERIPLKWMPRSTHLLPKFFRYRQNHLMTATALDLATTTTTTVEVNTSETLARRLRAHLQAIATQRLAITYQKAAKGLLLSPPNTIHQVTEALEQLMAEDAAAMRPLSPPWSSARRAVACQRRASSTARRGSDALPAMQRGRKTG